MTWWQWWPSRRRLARRVDELERMVVQLHGQRRVLTARVADLEARMGDREAAARMAAEARTAQR